MTQQEYFDRESKIAWLKMGLYLFYSPKIADYYCRELDKAKWSTDAFNSFLQRFLYR